MLFKASGFQDERKSVRKKKKKKISAEEREKIFKKF